MDAFGQKFQLNLSPARSLLSNDFIFLSREEENRVKISNNPQVEKCSFLIENEEFRGNLETCQGVQGMWMDKTRTYVIKPFYNTSQESIDSSYNTLRQKSV